MLHKAILADLIHFALPKHEAQLRMEELEELVKTYGGAVVVKTIQRRAKPDGRTFIGKGKVEELVQEAKELGADLLVINHVLKPGQAYNLEEEFRKVGVRVWDRIDLILNIFDKHARTREAKLEIELARLRHMGPRIYNMGQELGRQRGGTGTRGGSGEGNTEAMKRHLRDEERAILKKLEQYQGVRDLQRSRRVRMGQRTVALVGYTNAGKTSLLNALTKRKEYAENALFATLDTRVGELFLPDLQGTALLSDTIGFIQGLPPELIQAFRATLSEAMGADVVVHVIDGSDPERQEKIRVVDEILDELDVPVVRRLRVYNKGDMLRDCVGVPDDALLVSAIRGDGLDDLRRAIASRFPQGR